MKTGKTQDRDNCHLYFSNIHDTETGTLYMVIIYNFFYKNTIFDMLKYERFRNFHHNAIST
jgi:hypothetical protein